MPMTLYMKTVVMTRMQETTTDEHENDCGDDYDDVDFVDTKTGDDCKDDVDYATDHVCHGHVVLCCTSTN